MPASTKPKPKVVASSTVAEGSIDSSTKKSTSSGASKLEEAASSKALLKPAAVPAPSSREAVEVESSPKPVKRIKKKTTTKELEPASSKIAPSDPHPSRREDV